MSLIAGHHDLDLDVLDQLSVGGRDVAQQVVPSRTGPHGAVVLATCNRYEVYLEAADDDELADAARRVTEAVAAASGLGRQDVAAHLHLLTGEDVAAHLFAVAAGLDSMVVGEQEISGQVRRALTAAREVGTTSSGLERMFQSASRSARAVANQTGLGGAGRSLVSIALELARERMTAAGAPPWSELGVLLVGTGSYAGASLAALQSRGARHVRVYSPSGRAEAFAAARGIVPVEESGLSDAVASADLIVACSGAAGPILVAGRLRQIRAGRAREAGADGPRPLVVVDLALRHDVDPQVADLPAVHLITLDTVAAHAPGHRSEPVDHARRIVDAAVTAFMADQRAREMGSEVVVARARVLESAEAELERWRRAAVDLDEATRERVVRTRRRAVRAALHGPTVRARDAARRGDVPAYEAALDELRGLTASNP